MKTFFYIAFAVLGMVVVDSYGPGGGGHGHGWGHGGPWSHRGPWGHGGPHGHPWGHGPGPHGHEPEGPHGHGPEGPHGHGPGGPHGHGHTWGDSDENDSGPEDSDEHGFKKYDSDDDWYKPCKGSSCGRPDKSKDKTKPPTAPTKEPPITTYHPPFTSATEPPTIPALTTEKARPTRTVPLTNPTMHPDPQPPPTKQAPPAWPTNPTWPTGPVWPTRPTREPTTEVIPETTTDGEEGFTTISPEVESCIEACPSTPEFNPVCGTDGQTYPNEGRLFCAKSCGVNVSIRRRSVCPPPIDDGGPPTPATTSRPTTPVGRTTSFSQFQHCMKSCRITSTFQPVCGSDLVTYMNIDRLRCAQNCGQDVQVLCDKACIACGFVPKTTPPPTVAPPTLPPTTNPPPTLPPTTNPPTTASPPTVPPPTKNPCGRVIPDPDVHRCIKNCPLTQEFNPVCGTNGVTFKNPGYLLCAQMCGIDVWAAKFSSCSSEPTPPPITSPTTIEPPPSTLPPHILTCIRNCPVTSEYDPVCGTDGLTYTNMGNLECSKYCGVDVKFRYKSRCSDEFDLRPTTPDIDGSKDVTQTLKPEPTTYVPPVTRPTMPTVTPKVTPRSTTLGFTIPPDVLNDIFGTKSPPTTKKPINPDDEDEDLDLDSRFGPGHAIHSNQSGQHRAENDKSEQDKSEQDKSEKDKAEKDKSDKDKHDNDKLETDKPKISDEEKPDKVKPDHDQSDKEREGRSSTNIYFPE